MMLKPQRHPLTHEELFVQRYAWLLARVLQLTRGDRHRAENLVHDAFVQFVLACPDLDPNVCTRRTSVASLIQPLIQSLSGIRSEEA